MPVDASEHDVRVLFLVDEITRSGGVRTRVTEELGCLVGEDGISFAVVSRCNARGVIDIPGSMDALSSDLNVEKIRGFVHPKMPHGGIPILYELSFVINLGLSLVLSWPTAILTRANVIYAHNNEAGFTGILLSKLLGLKCIVDLHGVEVDENFERHPRWSRSGLRARFWRAVEKYVVSEADTIVCVSSAHKEIVERKGGNQETVHVIPCFADGELFRFDQTQRDLVRKRLSIDDDEILLVHSGILQFSTDGYDAITLVRKLSGIPRKRLLVLAPDRETIEKVDNLIREDGPDAPIVISCPRKDIPSYLSAGDVALLVRKDTLVNRVASPTKFGEYLLCGLPVVVSDHIGDASCLVRKHSVGAVLDGDWLSHETMTLEPNVLRSLLSMGTRLRSREVGETHLSKKAWASRFVGLLRVCRE